MLYALKLKKLEKKIYENKELLQDEKDNEKILLQLEKLRRLESIKTLIAKELSRIVTQ